MDEIEIVALLPGVNFAPQTVEEEIIQNVRAILSTRKGTVPLDREFGLSWDFVDAPLPVAQAQVSAEVIRQIRRYEPRARVISVRIDPTADAADGQMRPIVRIGVNP